MEMGGRCIDWLRRVEEFVERKRRRVEGEECLLLGGRTRVRKGGEDKVSFHPKAGTLRGGVSTHA